MGSFAYTCCVSGLPIEAGTKVRFLALTQSEHGRPNEYRCYVHGRWQLRTVPIRARYNDYGSVEKVRKSLAARVFFQSFKHDVMEMGVGDNTCHDAPVRKGMEMSQWLNALREGRVSVRAGFHGLSDRPDDFPARWAERRKELDAERERQDEQTAGGAPTMARVRKLIRDAGLALSDGDFAPGVLVDEVSPGYIRVRAGDRHGESTPDLSAIARLLSDYATMIVAGSGNYPDSAEVLVGPKPGTKGFFRGVAGDDEPRERPVASAMIREDVWQHLAGQTLEGISRSVDLKAMLEGAEKAMREDAALEERRAKRDPKNDTRLFIEAMRLREDFHNPFRAHLRGAEGISGFSLRTSYELALRLHRDKAELDQFVRDLCETMIVECAYGTIRGQWHPVTGGSQCGEWEAHASFFKAMGSIARRELRAYEKMMGE